MKITTLTMMMLLSGALAYCESEPTRAENTVTVCLSNGDAAGMTVARAKIFAASIFKEIGVFIDWQGSARKCPSKAIVVTLSEATPSSLKPGAFAYAFPYEGVHIQVFYDRIRDAFNGPLLEIVLAHVLVHEITHILEGMKQHSQQGVMKAKWDWKDYSQMQQKRLGFAPEDVNLIYQGLAARRKLAMLAMNTDQSRATTGR